MKIYNQAKTNIIYQPNLFKGELIDDKLFVRHVKAIPAQEQISHIEVINEYYDEDGNLFGKDIREVVDKPAVPAKDAYDEYEDIKVYVPFADEILDTVYQKRVETLIRTRYTISDELAILRQKETKQGEFDLYFRFCEECKDQARREVY